MTTIEPIERVWDMPITAFNDPKGVYYNVGNGCINRTSSGYVLINRIQNYHTSLGRHHPSQKLKVQTVSHPMWIDLDMDLNVVGSHIINQSIVYEQSVRPATRQLIVGLEDMRLFKNNLEGWSFIASTGHFEEWEKNQFWGQCLGTLTSDTRKVNWVQKLHYEKRRMMEKNWLPFMFHGELRILYETNPLTILNGQGDVIYKAEPWLGSPALRGSGSPIPWGDRFLYTIHEQGIVRGDEPLTDQYFYFHRFVEMDQQFQITRMSPLFIFREEGVEYTCGHCLSHDGTLLLIPYSSANGTDSNLMGVSVRTVEKMLL